MPKKKVIARSHRAPCIGDLDKYVTLHVRNMEAPEFGETNLTEAFVGQDIWAGIITVLGKTLFTSANIDVAITHVILIRYDVNVSMESWIEFEDENYKVIDVDDFEERHEFMKLSCTNRGQKDLGAAQA